MGTFSYAASDAVVAAKMDEFGKWTEQRYCVDLRDLMTSVRVPGTGESSIAGGEPTCVAPSWYSTPEITGGWLASTPGEQLQTNNELAEMEAAGVIDRVQVDCAKGPPLPHPLPERRGEHWRWPRAGTPSYHLNHAQWRQRFCSQGGRYKPEALAEEPMALSHSDLRSLDPTERDAQAAPAEHREEPATTNGAPAEPGDKPTPVWQHALDNAVDAVTKALVRATEAATADTPQNVEWETAGGEYEPAPEWLLPPAHHTGMVTLVREQLEAGRHESESPVQDAERATERARTRATAWRQHAEEWKHRSANHKARTQRWKEHARDLERTSREERGFTFDWAKQAAANDKRSRVWQMCARVLEERRQLAEALAKRQRAAKNKEKTRANFWKRRCLLWEAGYWDWLPRTGAAEQHSGETLMQVANKPHRNKGGSNHGVP